MFFYSISHSRQKTVSKIALTNLPEDGEILDHELRGRFHGVQLQQVDLRLLDQLADRVLGDQLV